jgi:queuosine precursor transporter
MAIQKQDILEKKTLILLSIFTTALILGNLLGSKVTTILGISVSVGIFAYPISFLATDILVEVRGKKMSNIFILCGIIALILSIILVFIGIIMPPAFYYEFNDAYTQVFSNSIRIIIASIFAFILSQIHDIWAFSFIKQKTKGRFLWFRNNVSTIFSQLIDTTLFMFIGFYLMTPEFTVLRIIGMIIPYWILKVGFAIIDTPFVYLGVKWLKSKKF